MGSPITLSGFNSIDFTSILNAVMQQERQPVTLLEAQQKVLTAQKSAFSTLASKLSALQSAADSLTSATGFNATSSTVSDSTKISFSSGSSAPVGSYQVKVNALARAQVTLLSSAADDGFEASDAPVATAGTLVVNGKDVVLTGTTTLDGLAAAINGADTGVAASVIKNGTGYHLMLTGQATGLDESFTVAPAASGGTTLSGVLANRQTATDAEIELNGVEVTSSTNTFTDIIAGSSFTVFKEDTNPVTITITASNDSVKSLVQKVMTVFNDAVKFLSEQQSAATRGETNNIGRDALVRGLRHQLTAAITATNTAGGGSLSSLAEIGFSISRTGELTLDDGRFTESLRDRKGDVQKLFFGTDGSDGVFGSFESAIKKFTDGGGLLPNVQQRLNEQATKVAQRIADMETRLESRRLALQKQFIEADNIIAQLNQQSTSLSNLSNSL